LKAATKIIFIFFSIFLLKTYTYSQVSDTLPISKDTVFNDSIFLVNDSIPQDSVFADTVLVVDTLAVADTLKNKNTITEPINFSAKDSMYISVRDKKIILFGTGELTTIGMDLKADSIGVNFDINEIKAKGLPDSSGKISGKPVFISEDKEYSADSMRYNFDTKKGLIYNVITQESEG
jgi:lipopolysaccharide assembly outer membrane protein LptD (OstA)